MKAKWILLGLAALLNFCCGKYMSQGKPSYPMFNHVFLSVSNLDSSVKFYTTAFDLKVTDQFTELDVTQSDSIVKRKVKIIFLKFPGQDFVYELAERTNNTTIVNQPGLFQHVGVEVKDIDIAFQRLMKAGGKVHIPVRNVRTNSGLAIRQAFFKGPDEELIELIQVISGGY